MVATLKSNAPKTSKAKTAAVLASAAGLAPVVSAEEKSFDPTTATFKVVVSSPVGPYTAGQVLEAPYQWSNLPEQKHITTYYDLALTESIGEHELKPKQIWVSIQTVAIDDVLDDPDAIDERRIEYLQTVQSSSQAMSHEEYARFLTTNVVAQAAAKLGEHVSEELQVAVETGIDGKKVWDGTPLRVEEQLVKDYGDNALSSLPIVGSRKTGKTTIRDGVSVSTDTVPPDFTGTTDYFIGDTDKGPAVVRWYQIFVEAMPHVKILVNHRDLMTTMANTPANLDSKLIPAQFMHLWNNGAPDKFKVLGVRADIAGDISKYVNRVTQAIAFYQAKKAITTHLSKTVGFELVGGSVEASYKKTRPIQMCGIRFEKEPDGSMIKVKTPSGAPVALSAFIRYGRNAEACKNQGGQLPKLLELSKVTKKPKAKPTVGPAAEPTSFKIEKAAQLEDIFTNAKDYIGNHLNLVKERLADAKLGGRFCYQLVTLRDELDALIDEDKKTGTSAVVQRAEVWNKEQVKATANMEKDELERKKNLETATN